MYKPKATYTYMYWADLMTQNILTRVGFWLVIEMIIFFLHALRVANHCTTDCGIYGGILQYMLLSS